MQRPTVIIVMGVSGSGKSTVGAALADALRWNFHDADDDHSLTNIERMRRGRPLTDDHRGAWLKVLRRRVEQWLAEDRPTVLACSALTAEYRRILRGDDPRVCFVHLRGAADVILRRMTERRHYMPPSLLHSQLQLLEEPGAEERALMLDAAEHPDQLVAQIRAHFGL